MSLLPKPPSARVCTMSGRSPRVPLATLPSTLAPASIPRRAPQPQDVQIEIFYCGVCHSDLRQVRNDWVSAVPTIYPCVRTRNCGPHRARRERRQEIQRSDLAAVGCMVGSCGVCENCRDALEQYCTKL